MLIEIPDPEIILGIIVAFFAGLFALYVYMKISSLIRERGRVDPSHLERLEYYERQLIDMKIRLDSLGLSSAESGYNNEKIIEDFHKIGEERQRKQVGVPEKPTQKNQVVNLPSVDMTSIILEQITQRPMTSRDIQITLGRTREHTARLLKKIYQEGLISRDAKSKPYRYFITENGKNKLNVLKSPSSVVA